MNIIVAILIFCFLIIFHELGHFLAAKKCGIKVNEFSLGLGPTLFGITVGETKYCIKLLPLGGACMMEGEDEESADERAFNNKPLIQRALVVFAGPFFNFILAFILAVVLLFFSGVDKPIVSDVMEGYPAAEAGIQAGDTIVKLDSHSVSFYRDISIYSFFHPGEKMKVTYIHDGEKKVTEIVPKFNEESGRYLLGVSNNLPNEKVGFFGSIKYGFLEVKYEIYTVIQSLRMLFTGKLNMNELSGPVGIVKVIGDTYEESVTYGVGVAIMSMMSFTILLSANLGVMNLLPIPALDGGRLLLFFVEAVRRKKLDEKLEGRIHLVGFVLLILLMFVIMFNDIRKLFI